MHHLPEHPLNVIYFPGYILCMSADKPMSDKNTPFVFDSDQYLATGGGSHCYLHTGGCWPSMSYKGGETVDIDMLG